MGKRSSDKKADVKRLQLRREVIRLLAADSLRQVVGGLGASTQSACYPSKTDA
jgi:hypothetical protein